MLSVGRCAERLGGVAIHQAAAFTQRQYGTAASVRAAYSRSDRLGAAAAVP